MGAEVSQERAKGKLGHGAEMGIFEHLAELRKRLIRSLLAICIGAVAAYSFSREMFELLNRPYYDAFGNNLMIGTGPAEAFMLRLKVAVFGGILLAAPVVFYQIWLFVAPGLYSHERRLILPFVAISTMLFVGGIWFCYVWVFPFAFEFFYSQYQVAGITPTIKMTEHLTMMVQGLLGFGAVFEMPVLAYFLGRAGIIDHNTLIGGFRYAIVIIVTVAAVLTPPDVVTQLIMSVPLLGLYGVSILVVRYTGRSKES